MKATIKLLLINLIILTTANISSGAEIDSPVFRAMIDELDRSMSRLAIEDMPKPYFVSYRIQDNESISISARYGALIQSQREVHRFLYIELRVGDPSQDNSNFIGTWRDMYNMPKGLVEEDEYNSLRHQIWLNTDKAYKNALENLARKKSYFQAHPTTTEVPDFSTAESFVHLSEPIILETDAKTWETEVRQAAEALDEFSSLQDWNVSYNAMAINKRYINSEGSQHLKGAVYHALTISATAQAEDGQRLTGYLQYLSRDDEEPPQNDELIGEIKRMAADLEAVAAAPKLDEYAGPVLFSDYASMQLISQLFVRQLSPVRKPLASDEWISQELKTGKLAGRVNRRVLPGFVTITDEPDRKSYLGHKLAGYQVVDDEGVKCRNLTLVEEGRLITVPIGRLPVKKIPISNGHARTLYNQWNVPGITNLFVKPDKPKTMKKLVKELRSLCRDFGNEYGLLVKLLENPELSSEYMWTDMDLDEQPMLTAPVIMYRVYADDGRMEPVRGLVFDEATIRNLRDIVAMGNDEQVYNLRQPIALKQFKYPAAIITPSILIEEMELKGGGVREPLPLSVNPFTLER